MPLITQRQRPVAANKCARCRVCRGRRQEERPGAPRGPVTLRLYFELIETRAAPALPERDRARAALCATTNYTEMEPSRKSVLPM